LLDRVCYVLGGVLVQALHVSEVDVLEQVLLRGFKRICAARVSVPSVVAAVNRYG
jgi:hypothetical protein